MNVVKTVSFEEHRFSKTDQYFIIDSEMDFPETPNRFDWEQKGGWEIGFHGTRRWKTGCDCGKYRIQQQAIHCAGLIELTTNIAQKPAALKSGSENIDIYGRGNRLTKDPLFRLVLVAVLEIKEATKTNHGEIASADKLRAFLDNPSKTSDIWCHHYEKRDNICMRKKNQMK